MAREPCEIHKDSAKTLAKWHIENVVIPQSSFGKRIILQAAIAKGGAVDEIVDMLDGMGIKLSIDKSNPQHKTWLENHNVWPEPES